MEVLVVLTLISILGLLVTTAITFRFSTWARRPGMGRIALRSLMTLKVWVAMALLWFLANSALPDWQEGPAKVAIRIFLSAYIVLQSIIVLVAYIRYIRRQNRGLNSGRDGS